MQLAKVQDLPEAGPEGPPIPHLDRAKWLNPLVSVIVTHHDYSDHIEDALLSLLDQTHQRWECVVVDDHSEPKHSYAVERIVGRIDSSKIRLVRLPKNVGQIPAFYAGIAYTRGQFVCLLDPDDRYAPEFLEASLAAHLNETVYCPISCCEQRILSGGEAITGTYGTLTLKLMERDAGTGLDIVPAVAEHQLLFVPPWQMGWHWTSTSAMMFRRAALDVMRPHKGLAYKGSADSYLAQGAHLLGGTLRLTRPLVYRSAHAANAWLSEGVWSSTQNKRRHDGTAEERSRECLVDVVAAIRANGHDVHLARAERRHLLKRWRRSIGKRWRKWTGQTKRTTTAQA